MKVTLAVLRSEAARVYGADFDWIEPYNDDSRGDPCIIVHLLRRRYLTFAGRSKAAARRLALETLSKLPSREAS